MESSRPTNEILSQQHSKALPGMLNVLTILTLIGCGIAYLSTCYSYIAGNDPQKQIDKLNETREKAGDGFWGKMIDSSIDIMQKSYENKNLLLISGLIFATLCLIGALQMRKLKKTGFYYYLIGELGPFVIMAGLFGSSFFSAVTLLFGALIAIVFVILYSTQLKYLENK